MSALEKANVEVETYVSSKTITKGPFQFWRDEKEKFPVLFKLAQRFLSAPSTSAESERLFSTSTAIYTALRRSMSADTFQKLLFLSRNIRFGGYSNALPILGSPPKKNIIFKWFRPFPYKQQGSRDKLVRDVKEP